jgi:hypothetical protein
MCGYQFPKSGKFCTRTPHFWVQSTLSTHNMHSCPHHLARIVREVESAAKTFDLLKNMQTAPDVRYRRDDHPGTSTHRMTTRSANYAYVTVKSLTNSQNG